MAGAAKPDNRSVLEKGYDMIGSVLGNGQWNAAGSPHQNRGPTNTHGNVEANHAEQKAANPLDFTGTMNTISSTLAPKGKK